MGRVDGDWRELQHAETLLDLRRPAEAEQRLRSVLAGDPENVGALLILARALHEQERDADAETAARRALSLDPENPQGYIQLCDILTTREDGAGALDAAQRAVDLGPHDWRAHYAVARALLAARRPRIREAYAAACRSVELAPHAASAHNLVGICLSGLGNEPGARQAYRNALSIDPTHTLAQNNLAASELDSGKLRRAAGMLRSAVGNDPQEKVLHQNLDAVLLLLGRRIMWSLFPAAIVLGILLATEAPWWSRALAGVAYAVAVALLVRDVLTHLPRGVSRWGRGIFKRARWQGKYLLGLLALLSVGVLLLAFAPYSIAVGAGIALGSVLRVLGIICVIGWVSLAAVNLVRGK
jgi:Flp pilus assembly protein TadD